MTFFWVIVILLILLLITIDPRSWGHWAKAGWTDLGIGLLARPTNDFEIRGFYRKKACEHLPDARPEDEIRFPDPTLDRLIYEGRFEEANTYRMKRMMEARANRDIDAVETYAIYKAHMAAREAEMQELSRRNLRTKYPKLIRKFKPDQGEVYDPTEIVTAAGSADEQAQRTRFLEIEWKRLPVNILPNPSRVPPVQAPVTKEAAPDAKPEPEPEPEPQSEPGAIVEVEKKKEVGDDSGEDEYTGLISV